MDHDAPTDKIFLRNISITATVGLDCWQRPKPQQVFLDLVLYTGVAAAGADDDICKSINYSTVCKAVVDKVDRSSYDDIFALAREVGVHALAASGCIFVDVAVLLPKGILHAAGLGLELSMSRSTTKEHYAGNVSTRSVLFVKDLRLSCFLGINPHERVLKQPVVVNLALNGLHHAEEHVSDWQAWIEPINKCIEDSAYLTVEALVSAVANLALQDEAVRSVKVSVEKPSAYTGSQCPGVEIVRYNEKKKE